MKRLHVLFSVSAAVLAALASGIASAQPAARDKPVAIAVTKADLFAPRFHATGQFWVVQLENVEAKKVFVEKWLRSFGAGPLAEEAAKSFAATFAAGPSPAVVKRVLKHYRCPKRTSDGGGPASVIDCQPIRINYVLPPDPTDATALAQCGVTVDADVVYLGRKAKTVTWVLDPASPMVTPTAGGSNPRIRLLDKGTDPSGQEVRGITFSDNTDDPQERGEAPSSNPKPVFDLPGTAADGQSVVWTRDNGRSGLAKVFYYAVVLQLWSDTLQDYVSCAPYDPTIANRGN